MRTEPGSLFVGADYLHPLRAHGCVGAGTGWVPIDRPQGIAAPLYLKQHSWGEFVFDFQIAEAYARQGLDYYPKLVCCVPYTPVPGPRLAAIASGLPAAAIAVLRAQADAASASGIHVLYPHDADAAALAADGWLRREQLRYVWTRRGHGDFEDFLGSLSSKRRKNIRRERRELAAAGLEIDWCAAVTLDAAQWRQLYRLYAGTYQERGQAPYLTLGCLRDWAVRYGDAMQLCCARDAGEIVAMAWFFDDGHWLYGRHWGSRLALPLLHFELCYYQGIDYALRHGRAGFDAGVQGDHKLLRGFEPTTTCSLHWFRHEGLHAAVARFAAQERAAVSAQCAALAAHSAYRD